MPEPLIEVRGLKTWFPVRSGVISRITGHVRAVDGVDLTISQGETLGLVGESGCGKSTLGRSILRLVEPTAGEVYFRGKNILRLRRGGMRRMRREMAIIFQDPFASLDPRQTVGGILGEALDIHRLAPRGPPRKEATPRPPGPGGLAPRPAGRPPPQSRR